MSVSEIQFKSEESLTVLFLYFIDAKLIMRTEFEESIKTEFDDPGGHEGHIDRDTIVKNFNTKQRILDSNSIHRV